MVNRRYYIKIIYVSNNFSRVVVVGGSAALITSNKKILLRQPSQQTSRDSTIHSIQLYIADGQTTHANYVNEMFPPLVKHKTTDLQNIKQDLGFWQEGEMPQ